MPPTSNKKEDEGISIWRFITARHLLQRGGSRTLRESLRLTWGKPPGARCRWVPPQRNGSTTRRPGLICFNPRRWVLLV